MTTRRANHRASKMRKQGSSNSPSWALTVPISLIDEVGSMDYLYRAELTPEGILFRVIGTEVIEPPADWPGAST